MLSKSKEKNMDTDDNESKSMFDMINYCVRCNAIAYETSPDVYYCPVCEFEVEVIECG